MYFKTVFVFAALLCLSQANPIGGEAEHEELTIEEEEYFEDLKAAICSFFLEVKKDLETVWTPLLELLTTLSDEIQDDVKDGDHIALLKKLENVDNVEENETGGHDLEDDHPAVLPIAVAEEHPPSA